MGIIGDFQTALDIEEIDTRQSPDRAEKLIPAFSQPTLAAITGVLRMF
ncbi:hypothetical protein [Sphingomonas solaris]|nr:hypothetical protein [Sphingomonas solaris]